MENLTKEELQKLLKEKEIEEKDLKKQEELNNIAKDLKMLHQAFIDAGFSEEVATTMLLDMVKSSLKANIYNR